MNRLHAVDLTCCKHGATPPTLHINPEPLSSKQVLLHGCENPYLKLLLLVEVLIVTPNGADTCLSLSHQHGDLRSISVSGANTHSYIGV